MFDIAACTKGLSPPTRGNQVESGRIPIICRSIPAHAG